LLILVLAALGLAVNPSARSAELTTKPNAGGEAGAMSEPRYLLFWRAPEQALELVRQLGSKGDSRSRLLGFGVPMSAFDEEKQLPTRVHTAFATARAHDLAVMLSFDFHIQWCSRPDLWNWFDTNQPGYKAANRRNVEWFEQVSVPTIDTFGCARFHPFGNGKPQERAGPATRERRKPWRRQAPPFPESVTHRELVFQTQIPRQSRQRILANQLRRDCQAPHPILIGGETLF
jgi:hypothetical protein